ncbi:Major Facilitator Superfamily (MFS) [Thraustotheca clavata]|uniref:Major Facilitator Superfamily (MFS) n=1 Tax=Thraustotheca clavata TaxID=74557 RepID=A0A1W0A4Y3_9STRA|nr:Major Facilitator Superfamily (MFS) [Thraustotheca clavata]
MPWCLSQYWTINVPEKSTSECAAEEWLLLLPVANDHFKVSRCLRFHRWYIFLAVLATQFFTGSIYSLVSLSQPMDEYFQGNLYAGQSTALLMVGSASMAVAAALSGPALERRGPRWSMATGTFILSLGFIFGQIATMTRTWGIMFPAGICYGTGVGYLIITSFATLQKWFPDIRGTINGIVLMAFGSGGGVWNLFFGAIVGPGASRADNMTQVFYLMLLVFIPPLILATITMRTPPPSFRVHGHDMHGIASDKVISMSYVQDEYLKVGMTLVNYNVFQSHNDSVLEGTERQYYEQVKALTLVQCILSTDFVCLFLAVTAAFMPASVYFEISTTDANGDYRAMNWFNATENDIDHILSTGLMISSVGRLALPIVSDVLVRVFYANPAFARKLLLVILLFVEAISLAILVPHLENDYDTLLQVVYVIKFVSGGGASISACLVTDMYGVYNVGTMYGLVLLSWTVGLASVGLTFSGSDVQFLSQMNSMIYVSSIAVLLMGFVRTNSLDRFYHGYQYTLCNKPIIQIPFYDRRTTKYGQEAIILTTPNRSSFFMLDSDRHSLEA